MHTPALHWILTLVTVAVCCGTVQSQEAPQSEATEECLSCHAEVHPGIVGSWLRSRHATTTPEQAWQKGEQERRISTAEIDSSLRYVQVGCYECHSLNTDRHADAFEHNGYTINIVVSPDDCASCHVTEREQFAQNIMAHAHTNLVDNSLYRDFMAAVNSPYHYGDGALAMGTSDSLTEAESCLYCHGTRITVKGLAVRETDYDDYEFPVLEGWPNQGVGRINPDGSKGACSACHTRHDFSIETARKPYTCSECHKGPDVPAYKVYEVSKHGNIVSSHPDAIDFDAVPWTLGDDFTAPTCAVCHASLVVSPEGDVIAERSHRFNDRLAWRLFGVPYAHPHPVNADLRGIENAAGLPIATELDGTPVADAVIDADTQLQRRTTMKGICRGCHGTDWVDTHFRRLDNTIHRTNALTLAGTRIISDVWAAGIARGLPQNANIFDEDIERMWIDIWLFYANSTRFAAAMAGGGDYGVFANGRYQATQQLYRLMETYRLRKQLGAK